MPVSIMNLTHILPYMEKRFGKAKNMNSFLYIASAFSLGMFLNGRLYRGHQRHAGEISFVKAEERGGKGELDGRFGLLGEIAPFYTITDKLDQIIASNGSTKVREMLKDSPSGKVSLDMVVRAIKGGDMLCAELMSETFKRLGEFALNMAFIFNPEAIFFEPWTAECESCTLDVVRQQLGHYGVRHWGLKTEVLASSYGEANQVYGAAMLPLEQLFESPMLKEEEAK